MTLEGTDPKLISTWANAFTLKAIELARSELVNDLVTAVDIRKHSNNDQIQALRQVAAETKRDQIARLTDALKIAQAVGLETPPSTGNLITDYKDDTMYLRGTRALQADLERLNARENNDAYIPELSDLLRVQALLNSINLAPENLAVAKVDSAASPPVNPVKPKKTLSLALGVFLGMLLGVGVVIVRKTLAAR
ncbi:regulator of length of O-antigen component of lipopolysaccharide chains [plant metagenome]|uniref:Regulator of length of O-antigen component of lipopolysaccharide chains n=1 Tax=plant metagenome TaxID=1297885 RepID=A0A484YQX7_9ZZZZ